MFFRDTKDFKRWPRILHLLQFAEKTNELCYEYVVSCVGISIYESICTVQKISKYLRCTKDIKELQHFKTWLFPCSSFNLYSVCLRTTKVVDRLFSRR